MADLIGQKLGNYRLLRRLGDGGFAEVYLGEHMSLGTQAAIKVLYTHIKGPEASDFLAEARTIASLDHPSIIRIFDYDVQDGIPFFVMAYAPNGNLRMHHPRGGQLPLLLVNNYVCQISAALQFAHDEKIIHRDIKPENILVGRRDEILLSDFGLALIEQSARMQSTQAILGTALYMAPEQLQGKPRVSSDQYALGVLVYEWLCGARPFNGTFMELYSQHISVPPRPLRAHRPELSRDIERVVLTALAKDPAQRFSSIRAFAGAFAQAVQQSLQHTQGQQSLPGMTNSQVSLPLLRIAGPASPDEPLPPVASPTGPNKMLPRGARPLTNARLPLGPLDMPQPLPPMVATPGTAFVPPPQSAPQVPFYRVEDLKPDARERKPLLSRRVVILGAGMGALLAIGGSGLMLLSPRPQPGTPLGTLYYTYRGHTSSVLALGWSLDGRYIATTSFDNTVQVWNASDGKGAYIYKGHSDSVNAVAWSPSNKRIASASDDTTVQVWNASDGSASYIYKRHSASVAALAWSPNGTRIASAGSDNTVQVWNASDGSAPYTYQGHSYHVNAVAWSPDGKRIASASGDNTVQVWNAADGGNAFTYKGHINAVLAVAWSPDGTRIASAGEDASVQVWNAAGSLASYIYKGHSASVTTLAWSPDSKRIASAGFDRTARIWNASDGSATYVYKGHDAIINSLAWSPNGANIATGSNDHTAQVWRASETPS
ncbi:MAG: serine/threonine-protein kinase [Ktedonobacteraceae bacterium]